MELLELLSASSPLSFFQLCILLVLWQATRSFYFERNRKVEKNDGSREEYTTRVGTKSKE